MSECLHQLIRRSAQLNPDAAALGFKQQQLSYAALDTALDQCAQGLLTHGLQRQERVAIYLPKCFETVIGFFGTSRAGGVFVPVNHVLKAPQVGHILRDCNVRVLITSGDRAAMLQEEIQASHDLRQLILTSALPANSPDFSGIELIDWHDFMRSGTSHAPHRHIDADMAAIFYTSGSTGKPKGVVLSHRNMVTGAKSVAEYLANSAQDRLLAVLPFSFDAGFSQLSTAMHVGAHVQLMDYLLPRDVVKAAGDYAITGLAGVPPLWNQLAHLEWPDSAVASLRYFTNTGGAMPRATLAALRKALPKAAPYLMYGLTEAFRSTYLPPSEVDKRPDSIGKAIPNAEIFVVRADGSLCAANEPGELVHRGALVAMGYWNDPAKTAERYKPCPGREPGLMIPELAVWSGDTVRMDEDGYLYFVGRSDDMIKTSGYRVSPTELEETLYASGLVSEAVALGIPHPQIGQAIVVLVVSKDPQQTPSDALLAHCKRELPNYMVPAAVHWHEQLPRNPNGKIDRKQLAADLQHSFQTA